MTINVPPLEFRSVALTVGFRIEDPNHDSPEEIEGVKALERYARLTGPRGGTNSVVRRLERDPRKVISYLSPHDERAFKLLVRPANSLWAFAERYDMSVPSSSWMRLGKNPNLPEHRHAVIADRIIRRIFPHFSSQRLG